MRLWDDAELLAAYVTQRSEEAFAVLVERHVALVYSSALRQVRTPHLAEEITQAVFIILAQKAGRLQQETLLAGWLCRTARFTACTALKAEHRRHQREQEAHMNSLLHENELDVWPQIAPLLDAAVAELKEADRNAIILRYYQQKSLEEVGRALGLNADTAQKRVARALDKLRALFVKRGVTLTTAVIAGTVAANSVQAAPVALGKTISAIAVAKGAAASGSTLILVKGALKLMAWTKMKTTLTVGVIGLLAAGTVVTSSRLLFTVDDEIAFEAEGTITYATAPDFRGSYSDTKHFSIVRQGILWKIRTTNLKEEGTGIYAPKRDRMDSFYEMGFDGTNIYTLKQQDP
jgi:RNA polymerase sigma factor (sigma-70 family)